MATATARPKGRVPPQFELPLPAAQSPSSLQQLKHHLPGRLLYPEAQSL